MISTVTPTVLRAAANGRISAILSVMVVIALIAFLVQREIGVAAGGPLRRLGRDLPLVIAPLVFGFADVVLSRLVTSH
jgi:hypothetical protein